MPQRKVFHFLTWVVIRVHPLVHVFSDWFVAVAQGTWHLANVAHVYFILLRLFSPLEVVVEWIRLLDCVENTLVRKQNKGAQEELAREKPLVLIVAKTQHYTRNRARSAEVK